MVPIDDRRESEANKKLPGAEALATVVEKVPAEMLLGVRRIVLYDDDAAVRKEKKLARHRPITGTNQAELDIYYDRLRSHKLKGKTVDNYALGELTTLLFECLHAHQTVTRRVSRQLSAKEERRRAETFARTKTMEVLGTLMDAKEAAKLKKHVATWSIVEGEVAVEKEED